jgi:hypothetical protein
MLLSKTRKRTPQPTYEMRNPKLITECLTLVTILRVAVHFFEKVTVAEEKSMHR